MKVYARASALIVVATLAVGAGLCWGQMQPQQTMQYPRQQPSQQQAIPGMAPNGQSPALSDAQIQQNVQNQLDADPSLKAAGVSATVTNGKVMLMGMVPDRTLKKRAAALAGSVAGVNGVENMISASPAAAAAEPAAPSTTEPNGAATSGAPNHSSAPAPASVPNGAASPAYPPPYGPSARAVSQNGLGNGAGGMALENRVTDALASDPVLGRYAITATVNSHNDVTLHGVVPTKMDKRKAQNLVKAMSGVHKVHNKLRVNPNATMLANPQAPEAGGNPGGNAAAPNSQNPAGMSPAQQKAHPPGDTLASQDAAGTGTPVIPQQPANASSNPATGAPATAATADMQQLVTMALRNDPVLQPYGVTGVITSPGTVTLQGAVPTKADRQHAEMLVKGVAGVAHVHNKIRVNPNATPAVSPDPPQTPPAQSSGSLTPQDVRTELLARLEGNPKLSGVAVYVSGHTVTLRGNVANRADRKHAAQIVKSSLPKNYQVRDHIAINKGMGNGYPPLL